MMKKLLSLILALAMILGMAVSSFAEGEPAKDAPKKDEKETAAPAVEEKPTAASDMHWLEYLKEKKYVQGYPDGTDGLDKAITRAETAAILVRAKDMEAEALSMNSVKSRFSDMYIGHWANGYVNMASSAANNFIRGHKNGTFRPAMNVSNAEAVTMIVRAMGISKAEDDQLAMNYPQSYVYKAKELGLLEGVAITDYAAPAVRENVFKLLYNLLMNDQYGRHTIVKGIFIENDRTESLLSGDEMVFEVMKIEQRANYVEANREVKDKYSQGTNLKLKMPKDKKVVVDGDKERRAADVENLLGKVAYVTLDERLKDAPEAVVQIKIDNTYDYKHGVAEANEKLIKVDGKNYTVELDEKYKAADQRLFRTYRNDVDHKYNDFYHRDRNCEYARVTVKNGKVVFIDSFRFSDVAPVRELRTSDKKVLIYSDKRDGSIDILNPAAKKLIGYTEKEGFYRLERDNIKPNDVIHAYELRGSNTHNGVVGAIVRQDAVVQGKFAHVIVNNGDYFGKVGENEFYIHPDVPYRPVYSTGEQGEKYAESKYFQKTQEHLDTWVFRTLIASTSPSVLAPFEGKDVTLLKDLTDEMQLIKTGLSFVDSTALVYEHLTQGMIRFLRGTNKLADLKEDWRTQVLENLYMGRKSRMGSTIAAKLGALGRGDLVYTIGEVGSHSNFILRIETWEEMNEPYYIAPTATSPAKINYYGYVEISRSNNNRISVTIPGLTAKNQPYYKDVMDGSQNVILPTQKDSTPKAILGKDNKAETIWVNSTTYSILPRTNVFYADPNRRVLSAGAMADLERGSHAIVISDYELGRILMQTVRAFDPGASGWRGIHYYNPFSSRKDIANTIVVINEKNKVGTNAKMVKLKEKVSYTPATEVKGRYHDFPNDKLSGSEYKNTIDPNRFDYLFVNHLRGAVINDIWTFYESTDSGKISDADPIVTNKDTFKVVAINENVTPGTQQSIGYNWNKLKLMDGNGDFYTMWMGTGCKVWGYLELGSVIRVDDISRKFLIPTSVGTHGPNNPKEILRQDFNIATKDARNIIAVDVVGGAPTANANVYGKFLARVIGFGNLGGGGSFSGSGWYPNAKGVYWQPGMPYVDLLIYDSDMRDGLKQSKIEDTEKRYNTDGFGYFYRLPLTDARYLGRFNETAVELAARMDLINRTFRAARVALVFSNNSLYTSVQEIILPSSELTPQEKAAAFKVRNAEVLAMKPADITAANLAEKKVKVQKTRADFDALEAVVKALLVPEKAIIEGLEMRIKELEMTPQQMADKFKEDHKVILAKTIDMVVAADKPAVDKALDDFSKLPAAAQALLAAQKTLLDAMKAKLGGATPTDEVEVEAKLSGVLGARVWLDFPYDADKGDVKVTWKGNPSGSILQEGPRRLKVLFIGSDHPGLVETVAKGTAEFIKDLSVTYKGNPVKLRVKGATPPTPPPALTLTAKWIHIPAVGGSMQIKGFPMGFDMTKIQATFDGVAVSGKQQADGDILFGITETDFPIVATIGGDKAKALEKFVLKVDGVVQDIK